MFGDRGYYTVDVAFRAEDTIIRQFDNAFENEGQMIREISCTGIDSHALLVSFVRHTCGFSPIQITETAHGLHLIERLLAPVYAYKRLDCFGEKNATGEKVTWVCLP
jgi:hypothetical protein